jgi:hypothetical protein
MRVTVSGEDAWWSVTAAVGTVGVREVTLLIEDVGGRAAVRQVIVAHRVVPAARDALRTAGVSWLDVAGGRLFLTGPGVLVDVDVPAAGHPRARRDVLSTRVGLDVALAVLVDPHMPHAVRILARQLGRSPSRISEALTSLRERSLVRHDARALLPDLFWAVADVWAGGRPVGLRRPPTQAEAADWALTGAHAAASLGDGILAGPSEALEFFAPDDAAVRAAMHEIGPAPVAAAPATVRPAPAAMVGQNRVPAWDRGGWPLAHPVVVALDLAQTAQGRSHLDVWTPRWTDLRVWEAAPVTEPGGWP